MLKGSKLRCGIFQNITTGLKVFETENHKRTNSDRRNVELSSVFKICMSLTHFSLVSPFYTSFLGCLNVM